MGWSIVYNVICNSKCIIRSRLHAHMYRTGKCGSVSYIGFMVQKDGRVQQTSILYSSVINLAHTGRGYSAHSVCVCVCVLPLYGRYVYSTPPTKLSKETTRRKDQIESLCW